MLVTFPGHLFSEESNVPLSDWKRDPQSGWGPFRILPSSGEADLFLVQYLLISFHLARSGLRSVDKVTVIRGYQILPSGLVTVLSSSGLLCVKEDC